MSKTTITLLITIIISISTFAQQGINYKALLKDDNGNVLADTYMVVQFTIHQGSSSGTIVYQGDHGYTTDSNGLVILNIGTDGTPSIGVFNEINWGSAQHYLQTSITYNGNTVDFDAKPFMAVPYALHAENVTGLEKIIQTGAPSHIKGWRLFGVSQDNYYPVGNNAVDLSFASGFPTETGANGSNSVAMGVNTEALGYTSIATGYYTKAIADHSNAMGHRTEANGNYSTAMGNNTITSGQSSLAIGEFNIDVPNAMFVVGNGLNLSSRNNALEVLYNGTVTAPSYAISNITDDKALITKEYFDANAATKIGDLSDAKSDDDGSQNGSSIFLGIDSGLNDDGTNNRNVAVGFEALKANTVGYNNVASGHSALIANIGGHSNVAIGANALANNGYASENTAVGTNSLAGNYGQNNTATGFETLRFNTSAFNNSAHGHSALRNNTVGNNNSANGFFALKDNIGGSGNVANGSGSLSANTEGNQNTSIGTTTLGDNTTGSSNTAVGYFALINNTTGNENIAIGISAGSQNLSGSGNIFIGNNSGDSTQRSDKLFINNEASSNPLIYGEFDTNLIRIGGSLSIQNASDVTSSWRLETRPNGSLSLYRNNNYRGFFSESSGAYSSISDRRLKKDITALENGTLNKVMQLNPVSYLMKDQTDTKRNLGLISQEVQEIFPSITNYIEESELLTLSYTELIPILIKALQEQQVIIEAQKAKDVIQDQSIEDLVGRLNLLESKSSN